MLLAISTPISHFAGVGSADIHNDKPVLLPGQRVYFIATWFFYDRHQSSRPAYVRESLYAI